MTEQTQRRVRLFARPSIAGLCGGLVLVALSYTPSLLPRPFVMQGLITGISMAVGYGVGVFCMWVAKRFTSWRPEPHTLRLIWILVLAAAVAVFAVAVIAGTTAQNDVRALAAHEHDRGGDRGELGAGRPRSWRSSFCSRAAASATSASASAACSGAGCRAGSALPWAASRAPCSSSSSSPSR